MSPTRQDAWSQDEDLLLAEVVLRHIREGGTQLQAFEEVGKQLTRTSAACGFRWNSFVRKQYKSGIELAKKQRKELKKQPASNEVEAFEEQADVEAVPSS
ncbi:MAG: RsfA family transcriptional regulator, partial [Bacillus sp. (in: firmicutes)]